MFYLLAYLLSSTRHVINKSK